MVSSGSESLVVVELLSEALEGDRSRCRSDRFGSSGFEHLGLAKVKGLRLRFGGGRDMDDG